MQPLIVVNFKTYASALGLNAVNLARGHGEGFPRPCSHGGGRVRL